MPCRLILSRTYALAGLCVCVEATALGTWGLGTSGSLQRPEQRNEHATRTEAPRFVFLQLRKEGERVAYFNFDPVDASIATHDENKNSYGER